MLDNVLTGINKHEGGIDAFTKAYTKYGLKRVENGIMCREWVPAANAVFLVGDFSKFEKTIIFEDMKTCYRIFAFIIAIDSVCCFLALAHFQTLHPTFYSSNLSKRGALGGIET